VSDVRNGFFRARRVGVGTAAVVLGLAGLAAAACSDDASPTPPGLVTGADARPFEPPPIDATAPDAATDAGRDVKPLHDDADSALEAMMLGFWAGDRGYLRTARDGASPLTGYWIFAQGLDAILDGVTRTGGRYAGLVETFYLAQDAVGWTRDFYDDENWMALALLRAFDVTGKQAYLTRAESLFTDIMTTADDTSCCGTVKGGLWWDRPHTQKATASNAGAVVTAVRLFQRTNKAPYLAFAKRVWKFWDDNMVDRTTHAVSDHVNAPGGEVVKYKFTYNEGIMIGACLALYDATHEKPYLDEAHAIAAYMVASETIATPEGRVLFDGTESACTGDCPQFKGIGYRWLALLHAIDPRADYQEVLAASAASLVKTARDPATRNFGIDWSKPPGTLGVEGSISASMALSIFAAQAGPYPATKPVGTFEAEEGVLHGLGLEARYAGFGGWGYVAGWNKDGQWVDFDVKVPAGAYTLGFRYAAGAGDASRLVYVNGQDLVVNQPFAATATWDTYATVEVPVTLPAESTVSLVYSGGKGSTGFLNLDRLVLTKKP
jgi:predicted alpha-1,6-mannanase (GH76 family)